jgi:hypothetical protein
MHKKGNEKKPLKLVAILTRTLQLEGLHNGTGEFCDVRLEKERRNAVLGGNAINLIATNLRITKLFEIV